MISEEPADLQATIEQTDSGEQQYVLRALCDHLSGIREELSGIRTLLEAGHAASEAMRGQAQAYLEAQQARTQEYLDQVQIEPEPDFLSLCRTACGHRTQGSAGWQPALHLARRHDPADHGRPANLRYRRRGTAGHHPLTRHGHRGRPRDAFTPWSSPICVRPRRQPVSADCLPGSSRPPWARNASRWFCPRASASTSITGSGFITLINPAGPIDIIGIGRIEGIGETIAVRLLSGGAKGFQCGQSGHGGLIEADGTIHLGSQKRSGSGGPVPGRSHRRRRTGKWLLGTVRHRLRERT